ncbi:MAG: response regulator [Rhizobiaceae bacterium]
MVQKDFDNEKFKPVIDNAGGSGAWRILLLGIFLIVGMVFVSIHGRDYFGEPLVLAILGLFAGLGVFFLFALVLNFVSLTATGRADDFSKKLVDGMDSGLIVVDQQGRIVYANRAYADLIGAEDESEVGSIETVFSRRAEAADIVYKMSNRAKEGDVCVEEFRLADGLHNQSEGAKWFRMRARNLSVSSYSKPLLVWQVSDVTHDRARQETAFLELQNAIHYLDHAPAGFFSSEANGSIVYLNATLADWLGIDLTRFSPGTMNLSELIVGDGMALLDSVKADEENVNTTIIDLDMTKSDGTRLPVRLYHRVPSASDGAPGATRTLVLNRIGTEGGDDIALRDAEIRFTRFFDNTPIAIAALNAAGKIVRTNAPFLRMFGPAVEHYGPISELKYKKIANKEDRDRLKTLFKAALSGKSEIDPIDLQINGSKDRSVRVFVSPVADASLQNLSGEMVGDEERVVLYAMEITEQKALEEQFAQGQKMQAVGQLAGGVAHDFNNVLTAIIGFSDLLLVNHKPSDPSFQDIMNIKQNANKAASLVRQLLAFSRKQTLRPQVLQLNDALNDVRMLLDRLLGEKVKLNVVHGRDLWPVKVDITQFEQVIVNLSVNARDAMPDGGDLTIRTANLSESECLERFDYKEMPAAEYVTIEVIDTGTGMPSDVVEKIFEPFFSTKEVGKGTGLGLSTVYGITKQTGGFIYADSVEGEGTTFRLFLPRHIMSEAEVSEAIEDMEASKAKPEKSRDLTGNATILLVEDEDAVRAFSTRALQSRGYEVHEAASGVEALEVMEEYGDEIDLVISDVVMPEMDGPTLLGELRKTYPDLNFIFVSGYAEEAFAKNLPEEEREKFGFLAKPFSLKQLATTVKEMLEE